MIYLACLAAILVFGVLVLVLRRLPGSWPEQQYTEPGAHRVVLQVTGRQPILVIRELRRTTGADLLAAKNLAEQAPVIVASNLSETSAQGVVERLTGAGARATVVPMEPSL